LAHAQEYRKDSSEQPDGQPLNIAALQNRYVGMVVLPGHFITKIEKEMPNVV